MNRRGRSPDIAALLALLIMAASCGGKEAKTSGPGRLVEVRAGIDHGDWGRLLRTYVDDRGLIDYAAWKGSRPDRGALRSYLERFAGKPEPAARGNERIASLVNAYNAFTVDWILRNYPTNSIRFLNDSFTGARHSIGGSRVSLDDIEHETLRPLAGYRVHAALSCASRSCPPLAREAFGGGRLDHQLDARMEAWLARDDLNGFLPAQRKAEVSQVFRWNLEDFQRAGGLKAVFLRHAPAENRGFLSRGNYEIDYRAYDWGLNDQGTQGHAYGRLEQLRDEIRDRFR